MKNFFEKIRIAWGHWYGSVSYCCDAPIDHPMDGYDHPVCTGCGKRAYKPSDF